MKKTMLAMVGLALLGGLATAQASPVDVTYSVSGSAGNWLLDFKVSDNLGGTNNLYLFGVLVSPRDIPSSPVGWDPNAINGYNPSNYGGSNTNYNDIWITSPSGTTTVTPGHSVSGFQARSTASTMPSTVPWMAVAAGGTYLGPGCAFICGAPHDNPGFEGFAAPVSASVGDAADVGVEFALAGSNPLRGAAEFHFALPKSAIVSITVHDIAGRVVATLIDGEATAGGHSVIWHRSASTPAGLYFARMRVAGRPLIQRVVLLN